MKKKSSSVKKESWQDKTRQEDIRLEALRMSVHAGSDPDKVLENASAYYSFLKGENK